MLNPHHNININISYNMPLQKTVKSRSGKRTSKPIKNTLAQILDVNDMDHKNIRKNNENNIKKSNETKNLQENKKSHKKKICNRSTLTPDIYKDFRIKTDGPVTEAQIGSTFKKENKPKYHYRSTQPVISKGQFTKKAAMNKSSKTTKEVHMNSCSLQWKKIPNQLNEHIISQSASGGIKKKRAHSTFTKDDKVVSKLLNISLLASELGGSMPMTSDRKSGESSHSKAFKQCMTSIDMRIIRSMQNDVPFFAQKPAHQDVVRSLLRSNNISLECLTKKVVFLQRLWRKKQKSSIINIYKSIFQQATVKFAKKDKFEDVSDIALESMQSNSQQDFELFTNYNLASTLKRSQENKQSSRNNSEQNSFTEFNYHMRWIEENENVESNRNEKKQEGLNIHKYRQLVRETINKNNQNSKIDSKSKSPEEEGKQGQWSRINKKIANAMSENKGGLDSKLLLDELIKQSNINKKWIQDTTPVNQKQEMKVSVINDSQFRPSSSIQQQTPSNKDFHHEKKEMINEQKSNEDSFDSQQEYDKNKYQNIFVEKIQLNVSKESQQLRKSNLNHFKTNLPIETKTKQQFYQEGMDVRWINEQILQNDKVVTSYLDCGLNDFGINFSQKLIKRDQQIEAVQQEQENSSQNDSNIYSEDQAIGARFERANLNILRKSKDSDQEVEPQHKIMKPQAQEIVEVVINFLICEFTNDISVILKKSAIPPAQKRHTAPVNRLAGISTDHNSIQEYLNKLLDYVTKDERIFAKMVENINKDIAPSSLQILSYLRPEPNEGHHIVSENQEQDIDDQEGLFVVPSEIFQQLELHLELEYKAKNNKEMRPNIKTFLNFWHRGLFESYNECLDYQRPFGIEGKPYEWITKTKIMKPIKKEKLIYHLNKGTQRLLQLSQVVSGIIFQKPDSPFADADLSDEQMHMMNEERLSRILATQLIQNEQSWVVYNDQLAQLQVELSHMIEERLFAECNAELKKLQRRRKVIAEQSAMEDPVIFDLQQL